MWASKREQAIETATAYGLGAVGAVKGVYEVFVKPSIDKLETREKAWLALAGGVILYDVLCPEGQTLSEGVDHFLEEHKLLTLGAIAITAGHLANIIPQKIDPIHRLVELS